MALVAETAGFAAATDQSGRLLVPSSAWHIAPSTGADLSTPDQASGEGTHFLIPWLQRAILYDVRIKPRVRRMNL